MDDFLDISQALTGIDNLEPALSQRYRRLLETKLGVGAIDELLALHAAAKGDADSLAGLVARMNGQENHRALAAARQIVKLWYFSQYNDPDKGTLVNAGEPGRGVAWQLTGATAPGFSSGPYGYWEAKPSIIL